MLLAVAATALLVVPAVPAAAADPAGPPGPPFDYQRVKTCVSAGAPPTTVTNGVSWAQQALQFTDAWQFTRGADADGNPVKVAVIDTGVNPGPEFGARLKGLADLVLAHDPLQGEGLDDCDGHGTLVAGIIGAAPDPKSGFTGVAPDAELLSIRQSSTSYGLPNQGENGTTQPAGTPESLAAAITYAVDQGAGVINISEADCAAAGSVDNAKLTAAVKAAVAANVVIVAAAGNLNSSGTCSQQNTPGQSPVTAATPADLPGVLAVAAVQPDGTPASFSLAGSWVGIAAPGTQITASNPFRTGTGQVNKVATDSGTGPIQGTSFSAPYVSGVAALVRARFPQLTAAQVISRIEQTAQHPSAPGGRNDLVGFGLVDPLAALTTVLPGQSAAPVAVASALPPLNVTHSSGHPRQVALLGSLLVAAGLAVLVIIAQTRRARRPRPARVS